MFHTWREGKLLSVRKTDVQKITRVTGLEAFKIHLQQLGAKAIGNMAMEGGGSVRVLPGGPPAGAQEPGVGRCRLDSSRQLDLRRSSRCNDRLGAAVRRRQLARRRAEGTPTLLNPLAFNDAACRSGRLACRARRRHSCGR